MRASRRRTKGWRRALAFDKLRASFRVVFWCVRVSGDRSLRACSRFIVDS